MWYLMKQVNEPKLKSKFASPMLSYWEQKNFLNYDLIVVGAGFTGLSTAIHFKNKHTLVVEFTHDQKAQNIIEIHSSKLNPVISHVIC
jgi:ribulose 1,5-bisphosphate synthetase/thiazole synthase